MINSITRLDNGLRVVHKKMEGFRSIAMCVLTSVGSSNENEVNNGISHFIEHMMFKGTEKRTAFNIVSEVAGLGAQINAFTSKQSTCYYIVTVDEFADDCAEILSDFYFNSTFDCVEMEKEKGVVLEEIAMSTDTPDDFCLENLTSLFYKGSTLGQTILGTTDNINSFTPDVLHEYVDNMYCSDNTIICFTGNIEQERALELANKYFKNSFKKAHADKSPIPHHEVKSDCIIIPKDLEQANIAFAFPGHELGSKYDMASMLMSTIFGSGMSSRLFQEIRERNGLAYNVFSYPSSFVNNGDFSIYLGTNPNTSQKAIESVRKEILDIQKNGFTSEEIERCKRQLKGGYVLSQESTSSVMRMISKFALFLDKSFDVDERIEAIDNVTNDDLVAVCEHVFNMDKVVASYVGKAPNFDPLAIIRG